MKSDFEYNNVVTKIKNLPWEALSGRALENLMHVSLIAAREFSESLRISVKLLPDDKNLKEMSSEELDTTNLKYEDYKGPGDHAEFLAHFINKYDVKCSLNIEAISDEYFHYCRSLDDGSRAMTIFSREEELSGIFNRILSNENFNTPALKAFKYFLERHVVLDSKMGGHHDLTKDHPIDNSVQGFYELRYDMYRPLFKS